MSKDLIDIILNKIFDKNWTGRRGEKLTEVYRFIGGSAKRTGICFKYPERQG